MNKDMHQLRHCIRNKDEYLKPMSKSPNTNAILLMSILHSPSKVAIESEHISSTSKTGYGTHKHKVSHKLQAPGNFPPVTAIPDYATGIEKLSASTHFF